MDTAEPARRRWWQNHQSTVLVVIALFAVLGLFWLAWQAYLVHHRRAVRQQIEASGAAVFAGHIVWRHSPRIVPVRAPAFESRVSKLRRLLGDEDIDLIGFNRQLTAADREAIRTFPEAEVDAISGSSPTP